MGTRRGLYILFLLPLLVIACDDTSTSGNFSDSDLTEGTPSETDLQESEVVPDGDLDVPVEGDAESAPEIEESPAELDQAQENEVLPEAPEEEIDGDEVSDAEEDTEPAIESEPDVDLAEVECSEDEFFSYICDSAKPETCPGGMCVGRYCIGPTLDQDRWKDCGDKHCDPCEGAEACPADCGKPINWSGEKVYHNDTTITIWVHGFSNNSPDELAQRVYGEATGCGGLIEDMRGFGVTIPCGDTPERAALPNNGIKVEYYGGVPAEWLTPEQIAEIEAYPYEGPTALQRYGLIVAKFIRWRLNISGATHVNMSCHSMGCYITRYIIENNLENLAAENRFVRWFTSAGVISGARLARLYDNPAVREGAELIGLQLNDFVIMNPDFAMDHAAAWDHKLRMADSPYLKEMLIHHVGATDPRIAEALNITLLDLNNPGDEPNDGIMYTLDEYFHSQPDALAPKALSGKAVPPTHSYVHVDHMTCPDTETFMALGAAGLFHSRKVIITLKSITLKKDLENHELFDGQDGKPPAEITAEVEVRYNPYLKDTFGKDVLISDDKIDYRSPEVFTQGQGSTVTPNYIVFSGPIYDDMQELYLKMNLLEVDSYKRFGVSEMGITFDPDDELISYDGQVALQNAVLTRENENVKIELEVRVEKFY